MAYDPADRVEFPYEQVRNAFMLTAVDIGCPRIEAEVMAQSAWHLTNRGLDGVDYTLRFLEILQRHSELPRLAITPLAVDMAETLNRGERRHSSFRGIPAPLLLLPAASFNLNDAADSDGVLFSFNDQTVVYSKTVGLRIESADPTGLMAIDPLDVPTCTASRVDQSKITEPGLFFEFQKRTTLAVPRAVWSGPGAAFDLSEMR